MEENAYQLLGLEQGPAATEAEIKKAYRKLALVKHPDKNPDNPKAADEFQQLQRAYDLLCDKEARAALDQLLKAKAARQERQAGHDEKRRKMMADLERREKGWEAARTQEETARAKLQAEMERLRRTAAERAAKRAAEQRAAAQAAAQQQQQQQQQQVAAGPGGGPAAAGAGAEATAPGELSADMRERLGRTLKVSWSRKDGEYSAVQLRQVFSAHGPVEDVVLREGKKRKGSALVVMRDAAGAARAADAVNGTLANPLLVVPFNKAAGAAAPDCSEDDAAPAAAASAAAPASADGRSGSTAVGVPLSSAAPAFAAGAPASSGVGSRPAVPLFAAGARPAGTSSLFPGAGSSGGRAGGAPPPGKPLFAAGAAFAAGAPANGSAAQPPAAGQQLPGAGAAGFASFSSFQEAARGSAAAGVAALGTVGLEDATLARMRQAAERRRLVEEMERAEAEAGG